MTSVLILGELLTGLCFGAAAVAAMLVGSALVLGHAITRDTEQREAPAASPRHPVVLPARYTRRVRGSSTSRTASPTTFTARIRPKSADDAAIRFQPMIGSRASSSRA